MLPKGGNALSFQCSPRTFFDVFDELSLKFSASASPCPVLSLPINHALAHLEDKMKSEVEVKGGSHSKLVQIFVKGLNGKTIVLKVELA